MEPLLKYELVSCSQKGIDLQNMVLLKFNIKGKFKLNSEITSPVQIDTNLTFSTLRAESVDNNLLIFLEN